MTATSNTISTPKVCLIMNTLMAASSMRKLSTMIRSKYSKIFVSLLNVSIIFKNFSFAQTLVNLHTCVHTEIYFFKAIIPQINHAGMGCQIWLPAIA